MKMADYKEIVLAALLHGLGENTENLLNSIKDYFPKNDVNVQEVIKLALSHNEGLISQAKKLSSTAGSCAGGSIDNPGKSDIPLVHIVSTLCIENQKFTKGYVRPEQLRSEAIIPTADAKAGREKYQSLWQDFKNDFEKLNGLNYEEFMLSLDTIMERYCWCIPSTAMPDEDVSLYQHSKLTAAFAGTLFKYNEEKDEQSKNEFLFVQGDMSGIQNYIFDIKIPASNAKLLRAKSFLVWVLSEIIARYLTEKFEVSHVNIVTSAGGKFLLLLPNTKTVNEKLPDLRLEIEKYFLKEFAGKITFVLSEGIEASSEDFQKNKMQDLINKIGKNGEEAKQKKMQAVLGENGHGHILEDLYEKLHKKGECAYCQTLPADSKLDEKDICKNCDDLIKIGRKLIKAKKIIIKTSELKTFGKMVELPEGEDSRFGYVTEYEPGFPLMPMPYTAPYKTEAQNELCTFEDIANKAVSDDIKVGNKKLAMFKADIDNLGLVFTSSWGEGDKNRISFARYAQLSRLLHYFFSGFVVDFINGKVADSKYKNKIYTVFSGGDDICVIGAWNDIMHFAADFQKELTKFTNGNNSVTISGGIALAGPKLPVRAIADAAEEALEQAKSREENGKRVKNAVSVFDVTVSWDEYDKCLKDGKTMLGYINKEIVSSGTVYKMLDFADRAKKGKEGNLRDMLWNSNYKYVIARNIKPEHKEELEFFNSYGVLDINDRMEKSRIAVSYALYSNRKGKEE